MSEQSPPIVAHELTAGYASRPVWARATFSVPSGSFTAILGPNGAGKSTLIRMILGQLAPTSGRLEVLGEPPHRGNPNIGYVPQGSVFDPELSIRGRDLVDLGVDGHRWGVRLAGRARAAAVSSAAIDAVGAGGYADRPLGSLSGGEQQRLLLAQALVGRPRLLLMDEPLSHLDVRNQGAMVQLITKVARERRLLPHIDLVLYIAHGRLAMGRPADIITAARLTEIYSSPVEVLTDSRGRVFVVGLEEEVSHPHA